MFEVQITKKERSVLNIILSIVCFIVGIAFFVEGLPTKTITIDPTGPGINAHLYRRSTWPPFRKYDDFIPNIKEAVVTKDRGRSLTYYSVQLETLNNKKISVTEGSLVLVFQKKLKDQINNSIQNKTPFTKTFRETTNLLSGLFFIVVGLFLGFYDKFKKKYIDMIEDEDSKEEKSKTEESKD